MTLLLFSVDEHKDDREDDTDDYACGKREIECKILAFIIEVTGKPSDPWYFPSQQDEDTHACDDYSNNDENLAEAGKIKHRNFPFGLPFVKEIATSIPLLAMTARSC